MIGWYRSFLQAMGNGVGFVHSCSVGEPKSVGAAFSLMRDSFAPFLCVWAVFRDLRTIGSSNPASLSMVPMPPYVETVIRVGGLALAFVSPNAYDLLCTYTR